MAAQGATSAELRDQTLRTIKETIDELKRQLAACESRRSPAAPVFDAEHQENWSELARETSPRLGHGGPEKSEELPDGGNSFTAELPGQLPASTAQAAVGAAATQERTESEASADEELPRPPAVADIGTGAGLGGPKRRLRRKKATAPESPGGKTILTARERLALVRNKVRPAVLICARMSAHGRAAVYAAYELQLRGGCAWQEAAAAFKGRLAVALRQNHSRVEASPARAVLPTPWLAHVRAHRSWKRRFGAIFSRRHSRTWS